MESPETFHRLARFYADDLGWRVLPVRPRTKLPAISDWPRLATRSPATIDEWWGNGKGYGIGIATGHESGIVVVDVDNGPDRFGEDSLDAFVDRVGPLPESPMALTANGRHIYFRWPGFNPAQDLLGPGIDLQAEGRYVVAPPSVHPSGKEYAWERSLRPSVISLADLPGLTPPGSSEPGSGESVVDPRFGEVLTPRGFIPAKIDNNGAEHWTRPGKRVSQGTSLTVYPYPDSHAVCYSTSVPGLEIRRPYQPDELARALGVDEPGEATPGRLTLVTSASVPIRRQRWLWKRRLPLSGAAILAGQEGLGKSNIAIDWAAQVTRGKLEGDLFGHPSSVIYVSAEDAESTVLAPRLEAAGADRKRVHFVRIDGFVGGLTIPRDLAELVEAMRHVDARLLVLDPFSVHLGNDSMDAHKERDVRRALAPLAAAMEDLEASAVGIMHWNKAPSMVALDRVLGSRAFTAAARCVLGVGPDPDDPDSKLLVVAKSNFAPADTPALSFVIEERLVDDPDGGFPIEISAVRWTGERTGIKASDLLKTESEEERGTLAEACVFLTYVLSDGPVDTKVLDQARVASGISSRTLERARRKVGVITEDVRDDRGKIVGWTVRLPDSGS